LAFFHPVWLFFRYGLAFFLKRCLATLQSPHIIRRGLHRDACQFSRYTVQIGENVSGFAYCSLAALCCIVSDTPRTNF